MSEMVERVKAAIRAAIEGSEHNFGKDGVEVTYSDAARAAIEAMREPTIDMIAAGLIQAKKTGGPWLTLMEGADRCPETWRAMIDVALAVPPAETG